MGATLVAISTAPADIAKMRAKTGVTFPLYADPDRSTVKAWGIHDSENDISLPATFVIDTGGKIVYRYIGEKPPDRPQRDHILDALRGLQSN